MVLDDVTFLPKSLPVVLRQRNNLTKGTFYFREDGLKNIPYVKLADYYRFLLNKELRYETLSDGVYKVTSAAGGVANIDTKANTLYSEDLEYFIDTTIFRQEGVANTYYDGAPFVRVKETIYQAKAKAKSIAFGATYGIDLFSLENDVLLPLVTCSNLFQGPTMLTCFYTPKIVYFIDPNDTDFDTGALMDDPNYRKDVLGFYENGKRSQEQADFNYNEIRFFVDTFHGRPGREALHESLLQYGNLDEALERHDDFSKKAKGYLKSTDQVEYVAGLTMLADLLADTGHTVFDLGLGAWHIGIPGLMDKVDKLFDSIGYDSSKVTATRPGMTRVYNGPLEDAYKASKWQEQVTTVKGDTMVYSFRKFFFNDKEWKDYYAGKRNELPDDEVGQLKKALEEHKDKGIKNVLIDVSYNGGGFGDVVFTIMALMGVDPYLNYYDQVNQTSITTHYEVDANFDGKFDEKDKQLGYDYRFGLVVSGYSFSCANLLPVQAKESGLLLLGDKTGGGACAVLDGCSAEGLYTRMSSQIRLECKDHAQIDFGVDPHVNLVTKTEGIYDFSKLYDLDVLSAEMNKYYDAK